MRVKLVILSGIVVLTMAGCSLANGAQLSDQDRETVIAEKVTAQLTAAAATTTPTPDIDAIVAATVQAQLTAIAPTATPTPTPTPAPVTTDRSFRFGVSAGGTYAERMSLKQGAIVKGQFTVSGSGFLGTPSITLKFLGPGPGPQGEVLFYQDGIQGTYPFEFTARVAGQHTLFFDNSGSSFKGKDIQLSYSVTQLP